MINGRQNRTRRLGIALDKAARRLEENRNPESKAYEVVMRHGSMHVGLYAPRGSDPQQPHTQDEVYVVMRGQGQFLCGDAQQAFAPGDVLFVPAGLEHRFVDFTGDLTVWVVFYGLEGGENE